MNEFPPARRQGLVIHSVLVIALCIFSFFMLWLTFQTDVGIFFTVYLFLFVITAIPVPILGYRAYALTRANYSLDRNTLRLVWGLRVEDIPVNEVEWVRPLKGLLAPINLPWLCLPGGILGITHQPDIGQVEFLASEASNLVLVATPRQIFAISPENPSAFLMAFQKTIEMGSLQIVHGFSLYPSFVVIRAWKSSAVRSIWLVGAIINVGLTAWVTFLIPSLSRVSLGFRPDGIPLEPVAGTQLILLPLLSVFLFVIGLLIGLFFYRKKELQVLAIILWITGSISAFFFLIAVFSIINLPI